MKSHAAGIAALLFISAIWGATFVVTKQVLAYLSVESFLFWRFLIAAVAMVAVAALRREFDRRAIVEGSILGIALFAGYWFQTHGLEMTTPSRSAFVTSLDVVIVPILDRIFFRTRIPAGAIVGAILAIVGTGFLVGGIGGRWNSGDSLTVLCAAAFAVYLMLAARFVREEGAIALTAVQIVVVGLIAAPFGASHASALRTPFVFQVVAGTALVTTSLAFFLLMWAQARVSATEAAITLAFEPVATAITSVLLYDEPITVPLLAGGGLIVAGMIVAQLRSGSPSPQRVEG